MNGENVMDRRGLALGASLVLHLLFLLLAWFGAPMVAKLLAPGSHATPTPTLVTFRMSDMVADVSDQSRVAEPPPTDIQGRQNSRAADMVPGNADTPVPAGGQVALDNSIPGTGAQEEHAGTAGAPDAAAAQSAATNRAATEQAESATPPSAEGDRVQATLRDALPSSSEQMLTGRRAQAAARPGYGARRSGESDDVGALAFGEYAFSTRAWDYEPYWVHMRAKLYAAWNPPVAYTQYGIIQGGSTIVRVTVHKDGTISDAKILQTDGHESLHRSSLAAMLGAAPFRPLPEDFPDPELVVTVRFVYMPPGAARNAP